MDRDQTAREQWHRYRSATATTAPVEPTAMMLAAYADRRIAPKDRAAVELWLARNPDRFDDILAARQAASERPRIVARSSWRDGASWAAAVCGLMLVAWMSFDLGQASVGSFDTLTDRDTAVIVAVLDEPGI